jgi:hypothetical protein
MRILWVLMIICLFISSPLSAAEPGKSPAANASLTQLKSQAQKIKIGITKESEVLALMGQPHRVVTKSKLRPGRGLTEKKNLKYGPDDNITISIEDGVATHLDIK